MSLRRALGLPAVRLFRTSSGAAPSESESDSAAALPAIRPSRAADHRRQERADP
eukprot:gene35756-29884_t